MNKYAAVILFGFVAVALSAPFNDEITQSAAYPDNSEETADLKGQQQMYSDFCIQARDIVYDDIKRKTRDTAADVFTVIFNTAGAIGQEGVNTLRVANNRLANQIAHPESPIEPGTNEIENEIAEGQQAIQQEATPPKTLMQAFVTTVKAVSSSVAAKANAAFTKLVSNLETSQASRVMSNACVKVESYEQELKDLFEQTQQELVAKDADLAKFTFDSIPCKTTVRIIRADSLCKVSASAQAPALKFFSTFKQ